MIQVFDTKVRLYAAPPRYRAARLATSGRYLRERSIKKKC